MGQPLCVELCDELCFRGLDFDRPASSQESVAACNVTVQLTSILYSQADPQVASQAQNTTLTLSSYI
ncbi:hypothetical protein Y032_0285g1359 [Ancylostoma ceylanicum]|uniref:Uncharacterized protein n=1 Tax=Ancylostoma ceylanicum TaxID=53326 RepID=A0A016S6Q7_9BILA|nr:hypothetical protein Y032_0285g1359 [Ancylostoma ceylanicum]